MGERQRPCPHPACRGKVRYATREVAEVERARIAGVSDRPVVPQRVYLCDAGWWHLTSQPGGASVD